MLDVLETLIQSRSWSAIPPWQLCGDELDVTKKTANEELTDEADLRGVTKLSAEKLMQIK